MNKKILIIFLSMLMSLLIFNNISAKTTNKTTKLKHEELYEKYKDAPNGSKEKEKYYQEYLKAYSEYLKNNDENNNEKVIGDIGELSSDELYEKYKNEKNPSKKEELYKKYLKASVKENNKNSNEDNDELKTLDDYKKRVDIAYEKYKNAPEGSKEKEKLYAAYLKEYKKYSEQLSKEASKSKEDDGIKVVSNKNAFISEKNLNYIEDTPNTPLPIVENNSGGGNVFKKLFKKVETSTEQLIGVQTCAALELIYGVDKDPVLNQRLNRVAERIAAVSDRRDISYKFKILKMNEVNAFAVPGGTIYVTRAMLDFVNSDSELAFVLGHEMGHQVCRHSIKAFEKAMLIDYFLRNSKASVISDNRKALEIANIFLSLKYSRDNEFESDRYGFKYLTMAGYNPHAAVTFFEKLKNKYEKDKPPAFIRLFLTHPSTHDRLIEMQNMVNAYVSANPNWSNK